MAKREEQARQREHEQVPGAFLVTGESVWLRVMEDQGENCSELQLHSMFCSYCVNVYPSHGESTALFIP